MKNLILTSSVEHLAEKLKDKCRIILPARNRENARFFPDREVYSKIPELSRLKGEENIVVHSGCPLPNDGLVELELILHILKDSGVKSKLFFTYFPYGMQDKIFEKGETNAARNIIEKIVKYYKIPKIHILDPHFGKRSWLKKYPVEIVSALPLLLEKAKKELGQNVFFCTPDKGGKRRTGISGAKKQRINSFNVEMECREIDFRGKTVAVVDDIIKTGGTLVKFQKLAKEKGAEKVVSLITHGVLPEGIKKIKNSYDRLYLTNSINQKEANIDIADLILENI